MGWQGRSMIGMKGLKGSDDLGLTGVLPSSLSDGLWELPLALLPLLASLTPCFTAAQLCLAITLLCRVLCVRGEKRRGRFSSTPLSSTSLGCIAAKLLLPSKS